MLERKRRLWVAGQQERPDSVKRRAKLRGNDYCHLDYQSLLETTFTHKLFCLASVLFFCH